ncbi:MAG TPA: hypothetical protein VH561_01735 [Micromonosporaceae bacterium]
MRRDLQRGLNPWVSLLPRYLFASALLSQLVALVVRLPALRDIARGVLGTAVVVGLVTLTALLVDYTTAPVGSVAYRLRGLASAWTSVLVVGFTLAWYVYGEAAPGSVFGIELVAFAGGAFGYWDAVRMVPEPDDEEAEEMVLAEAGDTEGWPFRSAP